MNFAKMMKQAQEMQGKMQKIQEEIAAQTFDGSSGGGAVTAKANGDGKILEIKISKEVLSEGDTQLLEELIMTAANTAIDAGKEYAKKRMSSLTAGMGLPGL